MMRLQAIAILSIVPCQHFQITIIQSSQKKETHPLKHQRPTHTARCQSHQSAQRFRPQPATTIPPKQSQLATSAFRIPVTNAHRASSASMGSHARRVHTAQLLPPELPSAAHLLSSIRRGYKRCTFLWELRKSMSDYGEEEEGAVRAVILNSIIHHQAAEAATPHATSPSKCNRISTSLSLEAGKLKPTV